MANTSPTAHRFQDGYSEATYAILRQTAKSPPDFFNTTCVPTLADLTTGDTEESRALDEWVENNEELLTELVKDILAVVKANVQYALPAHDERQILLKDSVEALRFYDLERPTGYKKAFVIPAIAHDIGRLLEGRLYDADHNSYKNWIPHAQLSYLLLNDILQQEKYGTMPNKLKQHFLYGVLAHSGGNSSTYICMATQTCDRVQAIGTEGFFRILSFAVPFVDMQAHYPNNKQYKTQLPDMADMPSVLMFLEYFARNMNTSMGEKHQAYRDQVSAENIALLLATGRTVKGLENIIFAREKEQTLAFESRKQRLVPPEIMTEAERLLASLQRPDFSPATTADKLHAQILESLSPVGYARLTDRMQDFLRTACTKMTAEEVAGFSHVIALAEDIRDRSNRADIALATKMLNDDTSPSYIKAIARSTKDMGERTVGISSQPQLLPQAGPSRAPV